MQRFLTDKTRCLHSAILAKYLYYPIRRDRFDEGGFVGCRWRCHRLSDSSERVGGLVWLWKSLGSFQFFRFEVEFHFPVFVVSSSSTARLLQHQPQRLQTLTSLPATCNSTINYKGYNITQHINDTHMLFATLKST